MNSLFYYSRLLENATNAGNAKKSGTFRGWQEKAIKARSVLKQVRNDYDKDLADLHGTYTTKVFLQKKAELDANYNKVVESVVSVLEKSLSEVIESKRRQFDKCSSAPSAEDLRLLQALNMRTSLSVAEIANTIAKLNGNVQSLAVLRDIAAKHNIHIPVGATTPEEFDAQMERAREFSLDRLREIDTIDKNAGYKTRAFYDYPDHPGEASHLYGPLDNNVLTTEQIATATKQAREKAARAAEPAEAPAASDTTSDSTPEMWAEVTVNGIQSLSTIAAQFHVSTQQIRDANPGITLDRLYTGDKIFVPSTKFSFQPDASGTHVQPENVRAVPRPIEKIPTGPNGEKIGDDVSVLP